MNGHSLSATAVAVHPFVPPGRKPSLRLVRPTEPQDGAPTLASRWRGPPPIQQVPASALIAGLAGEAAQLCDWLGERQDMPRLVRDEAMASVGSWVSRLRSAERKARAAEEAARTLHGLENLMARLEAELASERALVAHLREQTVDLREKLATTEMLVDGPADADGETPPEAERADGEPAA